MSKSVDPSCSGSDRRSFRFSCWPSPAPCARPARRVRSLTLDAVTGGIWPSSPPGESPKLGATLIHFSYVTVLALGLYEAAWIAKQLWDAEAPTSYLFLVLGAVLWLPAVGFVAYELLRRARDVPTLWRTS